MRIAITTLLYIFLFTLALGCSSADTAAQKGAAVATAPFRLLDVTSGRGRSAESYWYSPTSEKTIRCYHNFDWDGRTTSIRECEQMKIPRQVLPSAELLALNLGRGHATQSIWQNGPLQMAICVHDTAWRSGSTLEAVSCSSFKRPPQVDKNAIVVSINSGSGIMAQSFWSSPDGLLRVCDHEKTSMWLFGGTILGNVITCQGMAFPTTSVPLNYQNFRLAGVTADRSRPFESYWQHSDGLIIQCIHSKEHEAFRKNRMGKAEYCRNWYSTPSLN